MSRYSITPAEAITLRKRLLEEPVFREEFIKMEPVQDMVNDRLISVRFPKTHAKYVKMKEENGQKIYEIVCFALRKNPTEVNLTELDDEDFEGEEDTSVKKDSIRLDQHFWDDVRIVVEARISDWNLSSKLKTIIEAYQSGDAEPLYGLIKPICASRLWRILSSNEEGVIHDMVSLISQKLSSSGLLDSINYPGALPFYIYRIADTLFRKQSICKITECFPNSEFGTDDYDPKKVGYAHLTMVADEVRLVNLFGDSWYQWTLQEPFCDAVIKEYNPYSKNPCYQPSKVKNLAIAAVIDTVLAQLKAEKGVGGKFPARNPKVNYNQTDKNGNERTSKNWKPIETSVEFFEKYTKEFESLITDIRPNDCIQNEEGEQEESKIETLAREADSYYRFEFRTNKIEAKESINKFNTALRKVLSPMQRQLLWRSTFEGENSISIGRRFYSDRLPEYSEARITALKVADCTGLTPEEILDKQLEKAVNADKEHLKRDLPRAMYKILHESGVTFTDEDYEYLQDYFTRLNIDSL